MDIFFKIKMVIEEERHLLICLCVCLTDPYKTKLKYSRVIYMHKLGARNSPQDTLHAKAI